MAAVGDIEGRLNPGDAAADDQRPLGDRYADRLQLAIALHPLDQHLDDIDRLGGCLLAVLVHPGAVLADVGHLAEERVEPGLLGGLAEGLLVHARTAGGNHHAVQPVLGHGFLQQRLPGVGAHVLVFAGMGHAK